MWERQCQGHGLKKCVNKPSTPAGFYISHSVYVKISLLWAFPWRFFILRLEVPCPVNSPILFKKIYLFLYTCIRSLCAPFPLSCLRACLKHCVRYIKHLLHQISMFKFFMCRDLERKMYMYNKRGLFNYYFLEMYKLLIQSEDTTYISQITILKAMFYLY